MKISVEERYRTAVRHHQAGQYASAASIYQEILEQYPDHAGTLHMLGLAKAELGELDLALRFMNRAIKACPGEARFHFNRGNVFWRLGKPREALSDFRYVLVLDPSNVQVLENIASAEMSLENPRGAYEAYVQLSQYKPENAPIKLKLILLAIRLQRKEAFSYLDEFLSMDLENTAGFFELIQEFLKYEKPELALKIVLRGLSIDPANLTLLALRVQINQRYCYWENFAESIEALTVEAGKSIDKGGMIPIFNYLAIGLPAKDQLKFAKALASQLFSKSPDARRRLGLKYGALRKKRLKIGYISGDFRNHAMSHLIGRMFGHHDRSEFEIFAYSIGPQDGTYYRGIVQKGVDHFRDIASCEVEESARIINSDGIDILVDLAGYTEYARPRILALKPAPVQVSYLGLPGTMGADFIDYIIVDRTVVPECEKRFYMEKVAYMPDCYFVTDDRQEVAALPDRASEGLPRDGFVWCCFNRSYKLTPRMFDAWIRLLKEVDDSVLWLYCGEATARNNMIAYAKASGIDGDRLIFAEKKPKSEHLSRMKHADIFLDCFPVTAHTTAVDALWVDIPVITIYGDSLTSRVSASILKAAGLPGLITKDLDEYLGLALHYARNRDLLTELKGRIRDAKKDMPLFDTALFARNMEALFRDMWREYCEKDER